MSGKLRSNIDNKYKWDLTTIYKTDEAWHEDLKKAEEKVSEIAKYKDTFLMFDIPDGNNTIELKYSVNHLGTGIIFSIISLVSYGLLYYLEKRKHN